MLGKIQNQEVYRNPFPHIVVKDYLPAKTLVAILNSPGSYHSVSTRLSSVVNRIAFHGGVSSKTGLF